ncbi:hypothetical protein Q8G81_34570, partial [Klebsiella pneumoniae]
RVDIPSFSLADGAKQAVDAVNCVRRSGGKLQLPNIFQNLPEGWLRGETQGSICISGRAAFCMDVQP